MLAQERRKRILETLSKCNSVEVDDLSREMGVSQMTIRRDLKKLEEAGLLTRTYGGAVNLPAQYIPQPSFDSKDVLNRLEKWAIGATAARLVQDGDTIGLGSGTTCYQVAEHLDPDKKISVVTNALNIAIKISGHRNMQLIMTGGLLLPDSYSIIGPFAEHVIHHIHINKLFLGATGISLDMGVTTQNLQEASLYKAMVDASQDVIIVADHSKFDLVTLAPIVKLERVTHIITDKQANPAYLEKIAQRNVNVIVADPDTVGA